ncbi:MAG: hypothetical protein LBJ43_02870 [Propionibacteriaceae bacterium]|jgi:hypothetical protein|nr:hypothetical protein [Propionibacteriaceae bacterium]
MDGTQLEQTNGVSGAAKFPCEVPQVSDIAKECSYDAQVSNAVSCEFPSAARTLLTALAKSLTGELVALPTQRVSPEDAAAVAAWLATAGWSSRRITALRDARRAAGNRWPLPVAANEYAGSAAQFVSARAAVMALTAPAKVRLRDASTALTAGDARLLAEVPPHHGSVG